MSVDAWTDCEKPKTVWIRNCRQCPFWYDGEEIELEGVVGAKCCHPESGGGHRLENGRGRCPLVRQPITLRYDWPNYSNCRGPYR